MKPIKFKEANVVLKPPTDMPECGELPIFRNEQASVSCWELTPRELWKIIRSRKVWLGVIGRGHPPVFLTVEKPLTTNNDKGAE